MSLKTEELELNHMWACVNSVIDFLLCALVLSLHKSNEEEPNGRVLQIIRKLWDCSNQLLLHFPESKWIILILPLLTFVDDSSPKILDRNDRKNNMSNFNVCKNKHLYLNIQWKHDVFPIICPLPFPLARSIPQVLVGYLVKFLNIYL